MLKIQYLQSFKIEWPLSTRRLTNVQLLESKKVNFVVIDQHIDTTTSYGKLTFQILSSVAEFENEIRRERQKEGIHKALKDGKKFGRPKSVTKDTVTGVLLDMKSDLSISQIINKYNIARGTYFNIKKGMYNHLLT
jgi:DNA invertase Pin-like site-specific DNA recombinase